MPTAAFQHPLCDITSGPNSRDAIKRVYAVYKVLTKNIHIEFQGICPRANLARQSYHPHVRADSIMTLDITFDKTTSRAVVELEEYGSSSFDYFNLMPRRPIKIVVILDLWRDASGGGQYYIAKQYGE